MKELEFRGWSLLFDRDATRLAYASTSGIGPEACACDYCRNFVAIRDRAYPPDLRSLALAVGNHPIREIEVWEAGPGAAPRTRFYGGWFYFVGEIVRSMPGRSDVEFSTDRTMLPVAFQHQPVVHVSFSFEAPWVRPGAPPK